VFPFCPCKKEDTRIQKGKKRMQKYGHLIQSSVAKEDFHPLAFFTWRLCGSLWFPPAIQFLCLPSPPHFISPQSPSPHFRFATKKRLPSPPSPHTHMHAQNCLVAMCEETRRPPAETDNGFFRYRCEHNNSKQTGKKKRTLQQNDTVRTLGQKVQARLDRLTKHARRQANRGGSSFAV